MVEGRKPEYPEKIPDDELQTRVLYNNSGNGSNSMTRSNNSD